MVDDSNPFRDDGHPRSELSGISLQTREHLKQMFPFIKKLSKTGQEDQADDAPTASEETFMTKKEAAQVLGVSERTIFRHVRSRKLRSCTRGNRRGVLCSDVRQFHEERRDPLLLPMNRRTLALMRAELRIARIELDQCKAVLNMRWTPLDLTDEQLVERYELAHSLTRSGAADAPMRDWLEFLLRLRHGDLERMEALTSDPHTWVPFLHLIGKLDPKREQRVREPGLLGHLAAAHEHVGLLAYVWVVSRYGDDVMQKIMADIARRDT